MCTNKIVNKVTQGGQKTWKNLEFDNLGKKKPGKTLNLGNFEKTWKNLEI